MSLHTARLGGPGTILPRPAESLLSWCLAISCLSVSGYHYLAGMWLKPFLTKVLRSYRQSLKKMLMIPNIGGTTKALQQHEEEFDTFPCWIPLTTYSRHEASKATPAQRFDQFLAHLQQCTVNANIVESKQHMDDETLVTLVRSNEMLRRLASLAMRPDAQGEHDPSILHSPVGQQLVRLWPALLALPPRPPLLVQQDATTTTFGISLIMPCYREHGADVQTKLQHALDTCVRPDRVQVVLVDAGKCQDLHLATNNTEQDAKQWGQVKVVSFLTQAGRGPGLNFGAKHADGVLYAFCHADTRLPKNWDSAIVKVFYGTDEENDDKKNKNRHIRANSCAFGFGIDTSQEGLNGGPFPPGIRAVETTANLRCQWWSLPYGDQCLTVPACIFDYLGGFPHQPLMEDYELIALLRKRAALVTQFNKNTTNTRQHLPEERLQIVTGPPALCSPRRWQMHGVLHVTFLNSKVVNMYASGMPAEKLYQCYYGHGLEPSTLEAPWERAIGAGK